MTPFSKITPGSYGTSAFRRLASDLPVELSVGVTEALTLAPTQLARCEVIRSLLREVQESLATLHGDDILNEELLSFRRVVAEAGMHASRMSVLGDAMGGPPRETGAT